MNAIAWAIVLVAWTFAPDIYRLSHAGKGPDDLTMGIAGLIWVWLVVMFTWAAWPGARS